MNNNFKIVSLLVFFTLMIGVKVSAQVTLYSEDFDDVPVTNNLKGIDGGTTDVAGITNWTINSTAAVTLAAGDYFKVVGGVFESFNTDAPGNSPAGAPTALNFQTFCVYWSSLSVNIAGYTNVTFSVDLSRSSNNSASGCKAYYTLNGGTTWVEFGSVVNSGAGGTFSVSGLSGTTAQIRVAHWGTSSTPKYRHDNVTIVATPPSCTPASQASSLSVTSNTATTASLSWTNGSGSNGTIVVARPTGTSAVTPANGTTYLGSLPANSSYGTTQIGASGNYVVYKGSGTSATITGLSASTNYSFEIYSYTSGSDDCYNTASAPSVSMTTSFCDIPATQASAINFSGVTAGGMTINWTNSGSGNPVMVVLRPTFWPIDEPAIGTTYTANTSYGTLAAQIGNGNYVVFRGTGNSVTITGLHGGINYTVSIYEFAGTNCYNLSQVSASQTTTFSGNIYYVDDASNTGDLYTPAAVGNNANNGLTATTPKATLTNLLSTYAGTFTNGDIIYIDAGTYTTEINLVVSASGLSFIGAGGTKTFFDRTASTAVNTDWFMLANGDNLIFKDFTCQGYENNGTQGSMYESGQAITVGGDGTYDNNIYFENIVFNNNGQSGGNSAIDILRNTSVYIKGGGSYCNVWETAYTGGIGVMGNNIGLTVENNVLAYNFKSSSYDGAGIRIEGNASTNVKLKNVRIAKNKGVNGGGIGLVNGNLIVEDCIFEENQAVQASDNVYGAALFISCGTAHVKRCKFINNATSSSGNGGAIAVNYNNSGAYGGVETVNLIVDSCVFSNNSNAGSKDLYAAAPFSGHLVNVLMRDCQFLTAGNYNIVNNEPAEVSITVSYFGTAPTNNGTVSKTLSTNTLFTPNPTVPGFSGECGSIVLPVEISKFDVNCDLNAVNIDFETLSERNNDYFILEKAAQDGVFNKIAEIDGNGNSTVKITYQYTDYNALSGISYYRLSQVDFDGKIDLKSTKILNNSCVLDDEKNLGYYNPLSNEFTVQTDFVNDQEYSISVIDALGKTIAQEQFTATNNLTLKNLKLTTEVNNAIYFVLIEGNNKQESIKVVKY